MILYSRLAFDFCCSCTLEYIRTRIGYKINSRPRKVILLVFRKLNGGLAVTCCTRYCRAPSSSMETSGAGQLVIAVGCAGWSCIRRSRVPLLARAKFPSRATCYEECYSSDNHEPEFQDRRWIEPQVCWKCDNSMNDQLRLVPHFSFIIFWNVCSLTRGARDFDNYVSNRVLGTLIEPKECCHERRFFVSRGPRIWTILVDCMSTRGGGGVRNGMLDDVFWAQAREFCNNWKRYAPQVLHRSTCTGFITLALFANWLMQTCIISFLN